MKFKCELYYFESCPYCQKVLMALDELKLSITLHDILSNEEAREKLLKDTGRSTVPCLYINDKPMHESDDIVQWLKEHHKEVH